MLGHSHVMGQAGTIQRNLDLVLELAIGTNDAIDHVRRLDVVVKEQQFACVFVGARMGRDAGCRPIEIGSTQGFQGDGVHGVGHARAVPHADQAACVVLDVGIGRVLERLLGSVGPRWLLEPLPQRPPRLLLLQKTGSLDEPVAVGHPAALEAHRMQHAVTVVGVVTPIGREVGIGSVADIKAVQICRHLTNHFHVLEHILVQNGSVVAVERWNGMLW